MVMLSRLLVIGSDGDIKRGGLFWRHGDFVSWIPSGCNEKGIIVVCNTLAWPVYTILCIHGFMLFWGTPSTTPYSSPTPNSLLVDCCVINYYAVVQATVPFSCFGNCFIHFFAFAPKRCISQYPPHYPLSHSTLPSPYPCFHICQLLVECCCYIPNQLVDYGQGWALICLPQACRWLC